METRRGDEGCDQTNQIVVHVSRVTKGRRTSSHDGRYLECIKLHSHDNNYNMCGGGLGCFLDLIDSVHLYNIVHVYA